MAARRKRPTRRASVRENALRGRPNLTVVRQSISTQTVSTGLAKKWDILSGSAGNPANWWANHDAEIIVARIDGFIAFVPNLNEETIGNAFFQSYAAYWGVIRDDIDNYTHAAVNDRDTFNDPDMPWIRRGETKGLVMSSVDGVAFSFGPKGVGSGMYWPIHWELNVKLAHRDTLWLATNYTDDGEVDNSSWWYKFAIQCRY